ncbi:MAG: DUF4412 domain-containing protein [Bacteroidales bacterium]|nr:DUF4412 domain-containing protein [Bacteroidales bacterium]
MKKILNTILFLVICLVIYSGQAKAGGEDFYGIIVYNISYGESEMEPQMMAMMPKTMKMKIKGEKSRTEISMGMGSTIVVFNGEDKTGFILMDIMGQKYAMSMTADELEEEIEDGADVDIEVTDETKEIAGYNCKKAIVKLKDKGADDGAKLIVYFTDELGSGMLNYNNSMFKDIEGVMLEYSMKENDMDMTFTAISVTKKKVSDDEFVIPEGYNIMTMSEFENMFGGH